MRSKNKRLTAAKTFWVLDALVVVILGVRLGGETFYVYGHPEQTELAERYWLTAGEIVLDYLPLLVALSLAGLIMTALAAREQKKLPQPAENDDEGDAADDNVDPLLAAIDEYEAEDIASATDGKTSKERETDKAR